MPITLFEDKKDCCGCGACMNICPRAAIAMKQDACGFFYPLINNTECIECGACKKVCGFQNAKPKEDKKETYAASAKDPEILKKSSSGGVFAVLAKHILSQNGVVFGAAYIDAMYVSHIKITSESDLERLQGSKYVRSNTIGVFRDLKASVLSGKPVLFSGTPCQIAAAYGYLGKDYDNFYTMEIICHGTPSNEMFIRYVLNMEAKRGEKVKSVIFRDKDKGWGSCINGEVVFKDGSTKRVYGGSDAYSKYFLAESLYRESCYSCRFASPERVCDITAGDYWGIEKEHPEFSKAHENHGVSVLICNSEKGRKLFRKCADDFYYIPSDFEKAAKHNEQLIRPSTNHYPQAKEAFEREGWDGVENLYKKQVGNKRYIELAKGMIPRSVINRLKRNR